MRVKVFQKRVGCNIKNLKITHGGVLLLVKLRAKATIIPKSNTHPWMFLTFFKLYKWYQIMHLSNQASKKIGALIRSMKFLSPEVALFVCKSTIQPCMKYCCHVWASAPSYYLELLDKLQKRICRTVGPSLAASLEALAHH